MKSFVRYFTLLVLSLLLNKQSCAQGSSWEAGFTGGLIQGEASGGALISDDVGLGIHFGFTTPFLSDKIDFTTYFHYVNFRLDYIQDLGNGAPISYMKANNHHTTAGISLTIKLIKTERLSTLYKPFIPYVRVLAGLALQSNSINPSANFSFPQVTGTVVLPYAELGGGVKIRVNPLWSVNARLGFRTTLSDEPDGLIGNTNAPDIIGLFNFGLSRRIR